MRHSLDYGDVLYPIGSLLVHVTGQDPWGDGRDQWETAENILRDSPLHAAELLRSIETFVAEVPDAQQRYDFFGTERIEFRDPAMLDRYLHDLQRRCREIAAGEAGTPLSAPWLEPVFVKGEPLYALQEVLRWVYGYEGDDLLSGLYETAIRRLSREGLLELQASLDALAQVPTRQERYELMLSGALRSPGYAERVAAEVQKQVTALLAGDSTVPFTAPRRWLEGDED